MPSVRDALNKSETDFKCAKCAPPRLDRNCPTSESPLVRMVADSRWNAMSHISAHLHPPSFLVKSASSHSNLRTSLDRAPHALLPDAAISAVLWTVTSRVAT